ncbi:hypothetical protein N0V82_006333 [Gnomoniopsis sp. IMI 355080]|nr:hypothetical protein N0V82_006333 [Gnomoniopsis sp. IMI 355080]
MAKMADRCIVLLNEYFAEQPPEPLSPAVHTEAGDGFDELSVESISTLVSDHHSMEEFHRYPELPTEVQDRILEDALSLHRSRSLAMCSDKSTLAPPALAAVDKKTREQVFRIMNRPDKHCVGQLSRKGVVRSEEGK